MAKHIKYQWRITKYNPKYRNTQGHYTKEEWTSSAHIGKMIDGELITFEEYLKVETAYIHTIMKFLQVNGIKSLTIIHSTFIDIEQELGALYDQLYDDQFDNLQLKDDQEVTIEQIPLISKMILRGFFYCSFISSDFFIHFGDEYYMFIGTNHYEEESLKFAEQQNLFVEEMTSPLYICEENIVRTINWTKMNDSIVIGEETLTDISLDEYQKVFQLSKINPVIGIFPITSSNKQFFQDKITHKMDTSKYEYYLSAGS